MIRITKRNPYWQDEGFWVNAERPSKEEIDVVYNNLKRYEDEEEDGKIVRIPFMPGTTVYNSSLFKDGKIREGGIIEIRVDEYGVCGFWVSFDPEPMTAEFILEDIGKEVFFSKEEAEKYLSKRKENE